MNFLAAAGSNVMRVTHDTKCEAAITQRALTRAVRHAMLLQQPPTPPPTGANAALPVSRPRPVIITRAPTLIHCVCACMFDYLGFLCLITCLPVCRPGARQHHQGTHVDPLGSGTAGAFDFVAR